MATKALLVCALLACCLAVARADSGSDSGLTEEENAELNDFARRLLSDRRLLSGDGLMWRKGIVSIERVLGCTEQDEGPCLTVEEVRDAVHNKVVNVTILAIESEKPDPRLEAWLGQTFAFFFKDTNSSLRPPPRAANFSTADVHAAVSHLDFCPLASGNLLDITARLDADTLFEGAPVRGDFMPGVVVEVLVGHDDELEARGHMPHLSAHLGDSGPGPDAATAKC